MVNLKMPLSRNFTLGEFLKSATAERHENIVAQQYNPPEEVVENLQYLCTHTLQPIRDKLGAPMKITSGYRCPLLNEMVGSTNRSQHLKGQAADVQLSASFLTDPDFQNAKQKIADKILELTGHEVRNDVNANFYLFSYVCIRLEHYDIDQVIHEYGSELGKPGWVHIASSSDKRDKRQILALGHYLSNKREKPDLVKALNYGTWANAIA